MFDRPTLPDLVDLVFERPVRCDGEPLLNGRSKEPHNTRRLVEELIAELSAAFSCAVLGISPTPRPDHAAYLAHWLEVLRADSSALLSIASKAQAATDYLCAIDGIASPPPVA